jgi:hypothetical protein
VKAWPLCFSYFFSRGKYMAYYDTPTKELIMLPSPSLAPIIIFAIVVTVVAVMIPAMMEWVGQAVDVTSAAQ